MGLRVHIKLTIRWVAVKELTLCYEYHSHVTILKKGSAQFKFLNNKPEICVQSRNSIFASHHYAPSW